MTAKTDTWNADEIERLQAEVARLTTLVRLTKGEAIIHTEKTDALLRECLAFDQQMDGEFHESELADKIRAALGEDRETTTTDEQQLSALLRDPRYWRDRDLEIITRVIELFKKLHPSVDQFPKSKPKRTPSL